jgi:tetratricopeptide (TPR) repeat protein
MPNDRSAQHPGGEVIVGTRIERERVFSSLHQRMFGSAEPVMVDRFRIETRLGAGAMGTVYAAHDPRLDRRVALKLMHGAGLDPDASERVDREARALAKLRHPNVVTVHEVGEHEGDRFLAMDLVEGETLRSWMEQRPGWRKVVDVFVQAGRGLAAAHAAGLVHRDFKPDNVLVEDGHARVVDFGFARAEAHEPTEGTAYRGAAMDASVRASTIAGTPAYMAPEAQLGHCDARSDQFAFCASLYEALYGARPFSGDTATQLGAAIATGTLATVDARGRVPGWLRKVTLRGMSPDPAERWPSMAELVRQIERRLRRPRATAMVAGVGGLAAGALMMFASTAEAVAPCKRAGETMESVWNPRRAATIGEAFEATRLSYAEYAWAKAAPAFDAYAQGWVQMRQEACEATHVRREQSASALDLRMRCLDRRRDELDALAAAFERPDAPLVENAVEASGSLAPLEDCADMEELQRQGQLPTPEPPPEMYARLSAAAVAQQTGHYEEGLAEIERLAADADEGGYIGMAALAYRSMATLHDGSADYAAAERSAKQAIDRAERVGDDKLRTEAQVLLVSVLAQQDEFDRAEDWIGLTNASVQRIGDPIRLRALLIASEGNVAEAKGDYTEALAKRRRGLALREQFLAADDVQLASSHFGIGTALSMLGHQEESRFELEEALRMRIQALGPRHPLVAKTHNALAGVLIDQGKISDAREHLLQALEIGSESFGEMHPFVGRANVTLGILEAQAVGAVRGEPYFRRAVEIFEAAYGPKDMKVGTALLNLARVLPFTKGPQEAIEVLERVEAIYDAKLPADHADKLFVYNNLAAAQMELGDYTSATRSARRAHDIAVATYGKSHSLVALSLLTLGQAERGLGEPHDAIETLQQALVMYEAVESRPGESAEVYAELALAWADLGRTAESKAASATAKELYALEDAASLADGPG